VEYEAMRSGLIIILISVTGYAPVTLCFGESPGLTATPSVLEFKPVAVGFDGKECRVEDEGWNLQAFASEQDHLKVYTWFKGGSGRYWAIAIDNGSNAWLCLSSSTLGWRSLRQFEAGPLPWVRDFDGDGVNEFVFWQSFSLGKTMASGYGLIAFVYRLQNEDEMILDRSATGLIQRQLLAAYEMPLDDLPELTTQQRLKAAILIKAILFENDKAVKDEF
jgi:hypothetical protein